jgi:integrase
LVRFFEWLHLSDQFLWREPNDYHRLSRKIAKDDSADRKSILDSKIPIFQLNDLATLVRNADMPEKLWIVWCLNNSHGAAEVGRVQWEDIYLNQDHPWRAEGLDIWEGGDWVGFLRPKTDVLGWWMLWPETVELLLKWKKRCRTILGREVEPKDPIIIRTTGQPLYSENAKNGQTGFSNQFARLKKRCERLGYPVAELPPGTLRNQFADWCGGDEANAKYVEEYFNRIKNL